MPMKVGFGGGVICAARCGSVPREWAVFALMRLSVADRVGAVDELNVSVGLIGDSREGVIIA